MDAFLELLEALRARPYHVRKLRICGPTDLLAGVRSQAASLQGGTGCTSGRLSDAPLQRSHAEAPQPRLVLEEAAGAKRVQGVNYAYFGIRHQYLS
jgi:hypothetical protein